MTRQHEQNDVLRDCTSRFEELGMDYMLTGSLALVHYAIPRSTADIDIVLEIFPKHVDRFVAKFSDSYMVARERVEEAVYSKRMFNILEQNVIIKVDCVVRKDDEFSKQAFSRRIKVNYANDIYCWIISKEDLILSKLNWAKNSRSEFQLRDVTSLLINPFDAEFVRSWARKLDVEGLLDECISRTTDQYVEGYDG